MAVCRLQIQIGRLRLCLHHYPISNRSLRSTNILDQSIKSVISMAAVCSVTRVGMGQGLAARPKFLQPSARSPLLLKQRRLHIVAFKVSGLGAWGGLPVLMCVTVRWQLTIQHQTPDPLHFLDFGSVKDDTVIPGSVAECLPSDCCRRGRGSRPSRRQRSSRRAGRASSPPSPPQSLPSHAAVSTLWAVWPCSALPPTFWER